MSEPETPEARMLRVIFTDGPWQGRAERVPLTTKELVVPYPAKRLSPIVDPFTAALEDGLFSTARYRVEWLTFAGIGGRQASIRVGWSSGGSRPPRVDDVLDYLNWGPRCPLP